MIATMKRAATVVGLTAALVVGSVAGAGAQVDELVQLGEDAVFTGEQTVVCNTPDGRSSDLFEVAQSEGVIVSRDSSGVVRAAAVTPASEWSLDGEYRLNDLGRRLFLQRPVELVDVMEGDLLRLRLRFDVATGVLLASDVFNGDGTLYCSTRFVSFSPGQPGIAGRVSRELLDLSPTDDFNGSALPEAIAGFERISVTDGPQDEVVSAYYGDGVFSFTVLNSPRVIDVPELSEAPTVDIEGSDYQRQFELGTVVLSWNTGEGGFVLIGELPLDVQTEVLSDLPIPRRGLFERIWRGLFD